MKRIVFPCSLTILDASAYDPSFQRRAEQRLRLTEGNALF